MQKASFYLAFILVLTTLPLMTKIMAPEKEIKTEIWYWHIPVIIVIFVYLSGKVYNYYARMANQAEEMLKSLDE